MLPTMIASRLMRYGTVGLVANLLGYLFFIVLLSVGLAAVVATGITYVTMVGASYLANRHWTFRSDSSHTRDLPRYLAAYGIGLMVALGSMHMLASHLHPAVAQLLVIGFSALSIYTFLELVGFGRKGRSDD